MGSRSESKTGRILVDYSGSLVTVYDNEAKCTVSANTKLEALETLIEELTE